MASGLKFKNKGKNLEQWLFDKDAKDDDSYGAKK